MYISPVSQEWPKRTDKASLLTASRMLLHVFPSDHNMSFFISYPLSALVQKASLESIRSRADIMI